MKKIVNIVNFIRNVEPRIPTDLEEPVQEQMRLARQYGLPVTWLLQYDSLCSSFYVPFLKAHMPANHELGIWFELNREHAEAAGVEWRGRYSWDWHSDKGFSVGYAPEERERLADAIMEKFRNCFGFYPRVLGSWFFDAHLLRYISEKYGLDAACNCKDQYGTDGYTLWGGYWANAYYPSKLNSYLPARSLSSKIDVPVFRMLGSDPLYQYSADINHNGGNGQPVITLEPIYTMYEDKGGGGGVPAWCDWFLKENFSDENLNFSYAQAGQENSFGWPLMKAGLEYQFPKLAELHASGALTVECLGKTGRDYRKAFQQTPSTSVVVRKDWRNEGHQAIWYLSRLNRLNFYRDGKGCLVLRDLQTWSDAQEETFLKSVCRSNLCKYTALPLIDGMRWKAGLRFLLNGREVPGVLKCVRNLPGGESIEFDWEFEEKGVLTVACAPGRVSFDVSKVSGSVQLQLSWNVAAAAEDAEISLDSCGGKFRYKHDGVGYSLALSCGAWQAAGDGCWRVAVPAESVTLDIILNP